MVESHAHILTDLIRRRDSLDPAGMMRLVETFPDQCADAWARAGAWALPTECPERLVVMGMGGSAIGADLLLALLERELRIPMAVCRDYRVPGWVDGRTLAVAMSYSGNTEETLSAYHDARSRGARLVAITTGGTLAERAKADGTPSFAIPSGLPPRASLPYALFSLLRLVQSLGLWTDDGAVDESIALLRDLVRDWGPDSVDGQTALGLAYDLRDRLPVIYGAGPGLGAVAYRWKCQINENAKLAAASAALPEANHNESAGWSSPWPERDYQRLALVMLRDRASQPEVQERADVTTQYLSERLPVHAAWARGQSALARMLSLVLLGDLVSVYMAWLRGVDPTPVDAIEWLKGELARRRG